MNQTHITYRGFIITPMAAFDGGFYAAMMIISERGGLQRASGILGHFASPDEAQAFALAAGKDEVDRRVHFPAAA